MVRQNIKGMIIDFNSVIMLFQNLGHVMKLFR